jgi:hypothetical protein
MSYQRYDNFVVGKDLGELDDPPEILLREAAAELALQPYRQRRDDPLAVLGPLLLQDLPSDTVAHLPIQQREAGVDRLSDVLPRRKNELADVVQQVARDRGDRQASPRNFGRTINPTVYTRRELTRRRKEDNAFVTRVLAQPKVWIIGTEDDLSA